MNRVAQRHGLAVAYPAQTNSDNASACWNWFLPASQRRGRGEPAILAGIALSVMQEFGLTRDQIFVAGLSAGGAMAAILADTYGDVFSAAGVHSGLPRGSANNVISALSVMRSGGKARKLRGETPKAAEKKDNPVRRIIFQGDADTTVHPSNAVQITLGAVGGRKPARVSLETGSGRDYRQSTYRLPDGSVDLELWQIKGAGHAWSGGKSGGSFTEAKGPDASAEMVRFFLSAAQ
jgi:poly(hydroxyalkanoate) depolymerase family esterase